jgi:GNAT superfamily N-acetyltransferase
MKIRAAVPEDAAEIGEVHVASLRTSHAGLLPAEFLENLSAEMRASVWSGVLTDRKETHFIFVAEEDGQIVGFSACGPERSGRKDFPAEIMTIYLLEEHQGKGLGRGMLSRDLQELAARGYGAAILWVLAENSAARGFYEKMGGELVDEKDEEFGGVSTRQVAYGWKLG